MLLNNQNQKIDEFLSAVAPGWSAMDVRTFYDTINVLAYDPLIAKEWTEDHTIPMLEKAAELKPREIANYLHNNPSAIRCLMYYDLLMAKCAKSGVDLYMRIFNFYESVLSALCLQDPFTAHGTNIIHDEKTVSTYRAKCLPATPEIAKELGKLANACYHLSHGLYSDMNPQLTYDNFGPYYDSNKRLFAVKIFNNLKPVELWPETASLPVDSITIGAQYEGVEMTVDAATHAIYTGHQISGMRGWWCELDSKGATLEQIIETRKAIEEKAVAIYHQVVRFDFEKKKEFYWRQKAWGYKKLFDALGLPWEPSARVVNAGKNKDIFTKWNLTEDADYNCGILKILFDPRIELTEKVYSN